MVTGETTQLNKFRQRRLRTLSKKAREEKSRDSYFYPRTNLYTKEEHELLDTIYTDEPSPITQDGQEPVVLDNFWQDFKAEELILPQPKNKFFEKVTWFVVGAMLTSVLWLIFYQVNVHKIKTEMDTQIVFQKSAHIVTDKTADKEVTAKLEKKKTHWFSLKRAPKQEVVIAKAPLPPVRYHTVGNGDSLWTIAQKYYVDPSQSNIDKIMKANNMKRIGILQLGQKLVIP